MNRSTTACRMSGFVALGVLFFGWLSSMFGPAPSASIAQQTPVVAPSGRMIDDPRKREPVAAAGSAKPAPSAADARREQFQRQVDAAKRQQAMLERLWAQSRKHEPAPVERNHGSVRKAFRATVSDVHGATVRVLADNRQVALGAIVRSDGLIATKGSDLRGKLLCELADGRRLPAEKVAADQQNDLVLLRVKAEGLPAVKLATSPPPAVGSWLATSGIGVDPIAIGVVSVAAREIRPPRGFLGVRLANGDGAALVEEVLPGTAAAEVGLVPGDRIVEVNKTTVRNVEEFVKQLKSLLAGDKVRLKIARAPEKKIVTAAVKEKVAKISQPKAADSEPFDLTVTLGTEEMGGIRTDRFQMMNLLGGPLSTRRAGFSSAIQHDTVLAPHDCGGPVVDISGRVVALNIARAGRIESYALPASVVDRLVRSQPAAVKVQAVSRQEPVQK